MALTFVVDDLILQGHCQNVSESGLLASFDQPLDLWTNGTLSLSLGGYYLTINARVARTHDRSAGLSFLVVSDADRLTIDLLLDLASGIIKPEDVDIEKTPTIAAILRSQG